MKKSKFIQLTIVTTAIVAASCTEPNREKQKSLYIRSDSTSSYTRSHVHPVYPYYMFHPMGIWNNNGFTRTGYTSAALHPNTNSHVRATGATVSRGGFGGRGFAVGS